MGDKHAAEGRVGTTDLKMWYKLLRDGRNCGEYGGVEVDRLRRVRDCKHWELHGPWYPSREKGLEK